MTGIFNLISRFPCLVCTQLQLPIQINTGITTKGLLLVALPLLLEFFLLLYLGFLLQQSEAQSRKLEQYKEAIAEASAGNRLSVECVKSLSAFALTKDKLAEQAYQRHCAEIDLNYFQLMRKLRNNPEQKEALEKVILVSNAILDALDEAKQRIDDADSLVDSYSSIPRIVMSLGNELVERQNHLVNLLREAGSVTPAEVARTKLLINGCVFAGLAISILFILVAFIFYRQITRRLLVLVDNSSRLAQGQTLCPALSGTDEIATLDKSFRKMAVELDEAARKERALVDNALDMICSISADGKFAKVNQASLRLFSLSPEQLIGRNYLDFVIEEDRNQVAERMNSLRKGESIAGFECRLLAQAEREMFVYWSAHWSELDESWFSVIHNISDRKELEKFKQEFTAMIGHELKTPLTSLRIYLHLLSEGVLGELNETGRTRNNWAISGLTRMISLINELLDLEKLSEGKLQMSIEEMIVSDAVAESIANVQTFAEQRNLTIENKAEDLIVFADQKRIVQVLVNLLGNAIKYSPKNSKIIVATEKQGDWVEISVKDQGQGIPEDYLAKVFDRYTQVDPQKDQKRGGSGLGLTISKAIVEQHLGQIKVESKQGEGCRFAFTLPANEKLLAEILQKAETAISNDGT
ncbi:MAG: PAS domain S-box protein [Candidatus Obscuribacterales bacterium]|nr:PAS domain S-box protein [Candidatus Obscuribacterales bacterium]